MMREVAGVISAAVVGIWLLWFILPTLTTAYNHVTEIVDTSDPTIAQMVELGDMIYASLGMLVFLVTGYLIFAYATRRTPFDTVS